jgi:hypothetical protein
LLSAREAIAVRDRWIYRGGGGVSASADRSGLSGWARTPRLFEKISSTADSLPGEEQIRSYRLFPRRPQMSGPPSEPGYSAHYRALMSRILLDVGSQRRHRHFRRRWAGQAVSSIGSQLTIVAVSFQAYALTRSTLVVGSIGVVTLADMISGIFRQSVQQRKVPDHLQGRLSGTFFAGGGRRTSDWRWRGWPGRSNRRSTVRRVVRWTGLRHRCWLAALAGSRTLAR